MRLVTERRPPSGEEPSLSPLVPLVYELHPPNPSQLTCCQLTDKLGPRFQKPVVLLLLLLVVLVLLLVLVLVLVLVLLLLLLRVVVVVKFSFCASTRGTKAPELKHSAPRIGLYLRSTVIS
jgi:hypothetical protein